MIGNCMVEVWSCMKIPAKYQCLTQVRVTPYYVTLQDKIWLRNCRFLLRASELWQKVILSDRL